MTQETDGEPILARWWEREIDAAVASALGIPRDADDATIAARFRTLARLPSEASVDTLLWARFLYGIELARTGPLGPRGDTAQLANNVVEWAIVPPGRPDEDRFGYEAWDRELGVDAAASDEILRRLVTQHVAPRLARAGLYALL